MSKPVVLTLNVDDTFKVKSDAKVNKKWLDRTGTIVSVHPTSGCYVVLVGESQIVLFEHEMERTND